VGTNRSYRTTLDVSNHIKRFVHPFHGKGRRKTVKQTDKTRDKKKKRKQRKNTKKIQVN
jgi:hypothetical protein